MIDTFKSIKSLDFEILLMMDLSAICNSFLVKDSSQKQLIVLFLFSFSFIPRSTQITLFILCISLEAWFVLATNIISRIRSLDICSICTDARFNKFEFIIM